MITRVKKRGGGVDMLRKREAERLRRKRKKKNLRKKIIRNVCSFEKDDALIVQIFIITFDIYISFLIAISLR